MTSASRALCLWTEIKSTVFHDIFGKHKHRRGPQDKNALKAAPDIEFLPVATKRQPSVNQAGDKTPLKISKDNISKDNINKDVGFVPFWEKYPKKVGKKAAWKAWQKLQWSDALGAKIMEGLAKSVESEQWVKDSGRYVPHAATWINGERWEDDMTPSKKKNTKDDNIGITIHS